MNGNNQYTNKKDLIEEVLTLTCKQCGEQQSYANKYSYRRALGVGSDQTQKNKGLCGKCSRTMNRDWTNITQEYRDECTLRGYNRVYETSFNTLDEFFIWYKDTEEKTRVIVLVSDIENLVLHQGYTK